jgi:serine/threonine protein phosphatase PrpC
VLDHARGNSERLGMGCTVAGAGLVISDGRPGWAVFHLGDSRVYVLSDDVLQQVTRDHSEVQELIDAGVVSRVQARVHPQRHVITRAIGEVPPALLDLVFVPAAAGQRLLVATDGLTSELGEDEITTVLREIRDPQRAVDTLVTGALEAGGCDNVTVIVVDLLDPIAAVLGDEAIADAEGTVDVQGRVGAERRVSATIPRDLIERDTVS